MAIFKSLPYTMFVLMPYIWISLIQRLLDDGEGEDVDYEAERVSHPVQQTVKYLKVLFLIDPK